MSRVTREKYLLEEGLIRRTTHRWVEWEKLRLRSMVNWDRSRDKSETTPRTIGLDLWTFYYRHALPRHALPDGTS